LELSKKKTSKNNVYIQEKQSYFMASIVRAKVEENRRGTVKRHTVIGRPIRPLKKQFLSTDDFRRYHGKTVVFVSPHPDDAEISAGGTLHMLAKAGCRVINVVMTTGNKATVMRNGVRIPDKEVAKLREAELENASRALGIEYIRIGSGELGGRQRYGRNFEHQFVDELLGIRPDLIFVTNPHAKESDHPDHTRTLDLANHAIGLLARSNPGLEVWHAESPYSPLSNFNTIVKVTKGAHRTKLNAIRMHTSQVDRMPYDRLAGGFNLARSMLATELSGGVGSMGNHTPYAEAFHVTNVKQYLQDLRKAGIIT
jgi:LmbE family N-acetylglucosaminyl deacetylase